MKILTILSILFLYSCAMAPTKEELGKLDYGLSPKDPKQVFIDTIKYRLKDPDSLKILHVKSPKKMWSKDLYVGLKVYWVICGTYNAKNSFGAYAGYSTMAIWYSHGDSGILKLINGEMVGLSYQYRRPCD